MLDEMPVATEQILVDDRSPDTILVATLVCEDGLYVGWFMMKKRMAQFYNLDQRKYKLRKPMTFYDALVKWDAKGFGHHIRFSDTVVGMFLGMGNKRSPNMIELFLKSSMDYGAGKDIPSLGSDVCCGVELFKLNASH